MRRRGWCPTLYEPMAAQDGLLVRVKPFGGDLSIDAAHTLADAATECGNGMIQLTNRGNLQFRGLSASSAHVFARTVVRLGLADPDPAAERRRTVLVSPQAGVHPQVHPFTHDLARAIEAMLVAEQDFADLPGKFGIVVDGGGLSLAEIPGDIRVLPREDQVALSLDGHYAAICAPEHAVDYVRRLIAAFLAESRDKGGLARMRAADPVAIFAAAGLNGMTAVMPAADKVSARHTVGRLGWGLFGFGVAFGLMHADDLRAIADLVGPNGDGLRITPWRSLLVHGLMPSRASALGRPAFIIDPDNPALGISTCVGMPDCAQGSVSTIVDSNWLAGSGAELGAGVHVSGCAKGCAHPGSAAITLVGAGGLYDLVRDGHAGDIPVARGLSITEMAALLAADPRK